jgi:hypothetical protein
MLQKPTGFVTILALAATLGTAPAFANSTCVAACVVSENSINFNKPMRGLIKGNGETPAQALSDLFEKCQAFAQSHMIFAPQYYSVFIANSASSANQSNSAFDASKACL